MAYESITPETLRKQILDHIDSDKVSKLEGSFASDMAGAVSYGFHMIFKEMDALLSMLSVHGLFGKYLDDKCAEYGITRKTGTTAQGTIQLTGTPGATLPVGSQVVGSNGLIYTTTDSVSLGKNGAGTALITAGDMGEQYNIKTASSNITLRPAHANEGIMSYAIVSNITGGTDTETDDELRARLLKRLRNPPLSGNCAAYETWALEVDGISYAKAKGAESTPNTVYLFVAGQNGTVVDNATLIRCRQHVTEQMSVGASLSIRAMEAYLLDVNASVSLTGDEALNVVLSEFKSMLDLYISDLRLYGAAPSYNRILYILMGIVGVRDISALTLNGQNALPSIPYNAFVRLNEVTLNGTKFA